MTSITMKTNISLLGFFTIFVMGSLFSHAYAIVYDLDEMNVFVPDQFKIETSTGNSEKIFHIIDTNTGTNFGNVLFANYDTNPNSEDKSLDNLKSNTNNYQELKRGCDDGLLSINGNYCTVKYYAELSPGKGLYAFQISTQVKNGLSAIWTFGGLTENDIDDKLPTIINIVNSMQPQFNSNNGQQGDFNNGQQG
jgi:hypothetical protein